MTQSNRSATLLAMVEASRSTHPVFHSVEKCECLERALVLEAVGIKHEIRKASDEYTLVVAGSDSDRAIAELDAYANESRVSLPATGPLPERAGGWEGVLAFAAVVLMIALLQDREVISSEWLARGRLNAGLVCEGEWWRAVTALSLHVDLVHLISNLVIGGLFGLFAGRLLGSGLAWSSILLAGALGNAVNAWIQPEHHNAVGASTAIFGALGILSAYSWMRRRGTKDGWVRRSTPIVGGAILLGFTGTGGENTDVIAHLTGFASGLGIRWLFGVLGNRIDFKASTQFAFGVAALSILALCWLLALSHPIP